MRAEEFETAQEQYTYSSAKRLISRHPPQMEVIIGYLRGVSTLRRRSNRLRRQK